MKKAGAIISFVVLLIFLLMLTGCTGKADELLKENENLNNVIEDITDDLDKMTDKVTGLVSEAEENWELLQECIDEKQEENDNTLIITESKETVDVTLWTLIESSMYDVTGDVVIDQINLYTSAVKDEAGNIMWDDGQYFLVSLNDGERTFILFNERVQIGRVYYSIFNSDENGLFVTVSTFAGISFIEFTYSQEEKYFISKTVFETGDINIIHNTLPWD